jgi:hypothetical protein
MLVGGAQTIRTGDIGKGIQAGLGAYGGAGIGASMGTAGAEALGSQAAGQSYLSSYAPPGVLEGAGGIGAGLSADMAYNLGQAGVVDAASTQAASVAQQAAAEKIAAASPFDKLSAGYDAAKANPSSLLTKDNFKYMAAAAAPILADQAVKSNLPTTTTKPGMIRPYSYDPYGGTYTAGTPYEAQVKSAADGGIMGFDESANSPMSRSNLDGMGNTDGIFNYAHDGGGVMKMAEGGIAGYAGGGVSDTDIFNYFKTPGLSDTQIATDMQKYGVSAADIARATGTQNQQADYEKRFVNTLVAPTTDSSEFLKATNAVGLQGQSLTDAMQNAGLSQGAQYALTQGAMNDKGFTGGIIDASTGKPVDLYRQLGYTAGALPGDQAGLEGLYGNINYVTSGLQNLINSGKMSVADAQNAALEELARTKVSLADVKAATGKNFGNLFTAKEPIKPVVTTGGTGGGTNTQAGYGTGGSGYTGRLEDVLGTALPPGVSGAGITTVNPNGTITTRPNIPGIPEGGFTGMTDLRNAYTKGGGSLGYVPYAPKTIDEFNAKYNTLTGGSKQAYDYLTGKTAYSATPYTPTGEIQKPYFESVGRAPVNLATKKYVYVNGKYELNPAYVKPSYVLAGEKAALLTNKDKKPTDDPGAGNDWVWNSTNSKWEATPIGGSGNASSESSSGTGGQAEGGLAALTMARGGTTHMPFFSKSTGKFTSRGPQVYADGGAAQFNLGSYSDGGRLLRGPGDGVSDSIPATIGNKQPARLADGEFVVPARIVSELGNGSTEAGARKLYAMMDRIQAARKDSIGKGKVAKNSRADKYLPA